MPGKTPYQPDRVMGLIMLAPPWILAPLAPFGALRLKFAEMLWVVRPVSEMALGNLRARPGKAEMGRLDSVRLRSRLNGDCVRADGFADAARHCRLSALSPLAADQHENCVPACVLADRRIQATAFYHFATFLHKALLKHGRGAGSLQILGIGGHRPWLRKPGKIKSDVTPM